MGGISFLLQTNDKIIDNLKQNPKVLKRLDSFDIYQIVLLSQHNKHFNELLSENKKIILEKICTNFNFFDGLSLLVLLKDESFKIYARKIFDDSIKQVFNPKTILFMMHVNEEVAKEHSYNKQQIILI